MRVYSQQSEYEKKQKIYLNRNLYYNIKSKSKSKNNFTEYYLHTIEITKSAREMKKYIEDWVRERNKKPKKNEESLDNLVPVNQKNNRDITDILDNDFYFNYFGCIFCKESFNSFLPIFIHMNQIHTDWYFYYMKYENPQSLLKEMHVVAFKNEEDIVDSLCLEDQDRANYNWSMLVSIRERTLMCDKIMNENNIRNFLENIESSHGKMNSQFKNKNKSLNNINIFDNNLLNSKFSKNIKVYEDNENTNRIFFHSVTGGILHSDSEDSDYEFDKEDQEKFICQGIDQYSDICDSDKFFFKIWNQFIHYRK